MPPGSRRPPAAAPPASPPDGLGVSITECSCFQENFCSILDFSETRANMRPDGGSGVREAASFRRSRRREKSPRFGQQARCALRLACARRHMRAIRRANRAGADTRPRAQDTRELGSRRTARPAAAPTPPFVMFAAFNAAAGRTGRSGTKRDEGTTCGRQTNTASTERTCHCNAVSSPARRLPDSHIAPDAPSGPFPPHPE